MSETLADLMLKIERATPEGGDWCSVAKSQQLAAIIVAYRPKRVLEIGVWMGGSMIPMMMALQHLGSGQGIAIDPWAASASVVGQRDDNVSWWQSVDHDAAYQKFQSRLVKYNLHEICVTIRKPSDEAAPISADIVHIDGNHAAQAVRDVERFAAEMPLGGILILDDLDWDGGHVRSARHVAHQLGFVDAYPLGTGLVMIRRDPRPYAQQIA